MDRFFTPFSLFPLQSLQELITLLPIVAGLFSFRFISRSHLYVMLYFVATFLLNMITNILAYEDKNNLYVYNFFPAVEVLLLAGTYYSLPITQKTYRQLIKWVTGFTLLIIGLFYQTQAFSVGDFTAVRLFGIFLTLLFFRNILLELSIRNILLYSMFWISSGFLVYWCATFFLFLMSNEVLSAHTEISIFANYWNSNIIAYIVLCLLASIGLWLSRFDTWNMS